MAKKISELLEAGLMPSQLGAVFATKGAPTPKKRKWMGTWPHACDICHQLPKDFFYDAYIPSYGQWGIVCNPCGRSHGVKTGTGVGQKYSAKTLEKLEG